MALEARSDAPPGDRPARVLVLCTGNSCRSIIAEALFHELGGDRVVVVSAGSEPAGAVNPLTERVLDEAGLDHSWARSKSVSEFLGQTFDYVITVCDQARQSCPAFPGVHETLHWGYEDPAAVEGTEEQRLAAFRSTLTMMAGRIQSFITLARRDQAKAVAR
jgi:arsenate reductase